MDLFLTKVPFQTKRFYSKQKESFQNKKILFQTKSQRGGDLCPESLGNHNQKYPQWKRGAKSLVLFAYRRPQSRTITLMRVG